MWAIFAKNKNHFKFIIDNENYELSLIIKIIIIEAEAEAGNGQNKIIKTKVFCKMMIILK